MSLEDLDRLDIIYNANHEGRVTRIRLPFTAEQALDVCSREGDLLPSCCSRISAMRDIVLGSLREGLFLDVEKLADLVGLMLSHEGFDDLFLPKRTKPVEYSRYKNCAACYKTMEGCGCEGLPKGTYSPLVPDTDPWLRLALAWEALTDCAKPESSPPKAEDPTDLRGALHLLSNGASVLWMHEVFPQTGHFTAEQYPSMTPEQRDKANAKDQFKHDLLVATAVLRVAPALRTVYARLVEMYPDPVEGFAAVLTTRPVWVDVPDEARPGRTRQVPEPNVSTDPFGHGIVMVAGGLAIYQTEAELEEACRVWEVRQPKIRESIDVRRVRVSAADGIVLLPR